MIYLLYGNDWKGRTRKLKKIIEGLREKRPDGSFFRISDEDLLDQNGEEKLEEVTTSQALFGGNFIVHFDKVLSNSKTKGLIEKKLEELSDSNHIYIFTDGALNKSTLTFIKKSGAEIESFNDKEKTQKPFNPFKLAEAFSLKNKERGWSLYKKTLEKGIPPEETAGILFWQIKTLILVSMGETKGIKPFVVSKTQKALSRWRQEELFRSSKSLVDVYHDSRRGDLKLEEGLELFLLKT